MEQLPLALLPLIICDERHVIKLTSRPIIQTYTYFVARKLDVDLGHRYEYYNIFSRPIDNLISKYLDEDLLSAQRRRCTTYSLITEAGKEYLAQQDERKVQYLKNLLYSIQNSELNKNLDELRSSLLLDHLSVVVGHNDKSKLYEYMKLLGWLGTPYKYKQISERLGRLKLVYHEEVRTIKL